jgi:hypothetical protein
VKCEYFTRGKDLVVSAKSRVADIVVVENNTWSFGKVDVTGLKNPLL